MKKNKELNPVNLSISFGIVIFIILIFFIYFSSVNRNNKVCKMPTEIVNKTNNYMYDIVYTKDNTVIDLSIKKYKSKYLIEKTENNIKTMYYIHHTDLLEKASNGKYIKYRKDNIIDGLDNKYLILDYIDEISLESKVTSENELTCYYNRKLELSICINLDETITLKTNNYQLNYKVREIGNVDNFYIDIN